MRAARLLAHVILLLGCNNPRPGKHDEISRGQIRAAEAVSALERRAAKLNTQWRDVEDGYTGAQDQLQQAQGAYASALRDLGAASDGYRKATADLEVARRNWRFYQALVVAAAAVDARNLDQFRAATGARGVTTLDCSGSMSTAEFRRYLIAEGMNLAGQDVDHIVPRSLGGADHPANYRLLSASENRSLGNTWNREKCLSAAEQCAGAVTVSRKCGTFKGVGF